MIFHRRGVAATTRTLSRFWELSPSARARQQPFLSAQGAAGSLPRNSAILGVCRPFASQDTPHEVDALIVGGGIMGCSVGLMMKLLHPSWKICLIEQLDRVGAECSNEWRNAGTGHAALCEPNYTPLDKKTGEVDISKAVAVNQKFLIGLQWWTWLVQKGVLPDASFIQPAPHITFVHGEANVQWLRKRYDKLKPLPSFAEMEYTEDYDKIKEWVPLLCSGRPRGETIAATRHPGGTEVNFGLLTRELAQSFSELGGEVRLLSTVESIEQRPDKKWVVGIKKNDLSKDNTYMKAKYVFAGAGGGTLRVLQKAGLPEVKGYAAMPVSGKFLVCQNPDIIKQNTNKVYAPAAVGAPPMSVPHLDWRTIYGRDCIFFGPFAGFKPTIFNNCGSPLDWFKTLNPSNIIPFIKTALYNLDLVAYLLKEVMAPKSRQLQTLRDFVPDAEAKDWTMVWAGQRVQVVHPNGQLQFGTEVVASKDKTLVGLLGASPGASVSPHIAIEVLDHFAVAGTHQEQWHKVFAQMIRSYGRDINGEAGLYDKIFADAKKSLLTGLGSANTNVEKTFRRLDIDSSGSLSADELRTHLKAQGVDDQSIDALIDRLDADKSGDICADEFAAGFAEFCTGQLEHRRSSLDAGI